MHVLSIVTQVQSKVVTTLAGKLLTPFFKKKTSWTILRISSNFQTKCSQIRNVVENANVAVPLFI